MRSAVMVWSVWAWSVWSVWSALSVWHREIQAMLQSFQQEASAVSEGGLSSDCQSRMTA